ncbi:MAG: hypothetical protein ACI84D_003506 [Thalassolituus oleivorans]
MLVVRRQHAVFARAHPVNVSTISFMRQPEVTDRREFGSRSHHPIASGTEVKS